MSLTDALVIGVKSPVRQRGDITGTPGVTISNGDKKIHLEKGVIIAERHVHMNTKMHPNLK